MDNYIKKENRKLNYKKYYNKHKDNSEFMEKKKMYAKRSYYRRKKLIILFEELTLYYSFIQFKLFVRNRLYKKELLNLILFNLKKLRKPKQQQPQLMVTF